MAAESGVVARFPGFWVASVMLTALLAMPTVTLAAPPAPPAPPLFPLLTDMLPIPP